MHSQELRDNHPQHYDDEGNCRHLQMGRKIGGRLCCRWCGRLIGKGTQIAFEELPIGAHFQSAFDEVGKAPIWVKIRESKTGVCDSRRLDSDKPTASHGPLSPVVPVSWLEEALK